MNVANIYCVGRNYRLHAAELGNEVPDEPMIFTKPTHALHVIKNTTDQLQISKVSIPHNRGEVHFEIELVLRIADGYETGIAIDRAIDSFTLGLDLTLRDVQSVLKAKGHPWLAAKGFINSAVIGKWLPFTKAAAERLLNGKDEFKLLRNGELAQVGYPRDMIFSVQQLIAFIDEQYGLGAGDIIFTGTPAGVAPLNIGDELQMLWNGQQLGSCIID